MSGAKITTMYIHELGGFRWHVVFDDGCERDIVLGPRTSKSPVAVGLAFRDMIRDGTAHGERHWRALGGFMRAAEEAYRKPPIVFEHPTWTPVVEPPLGEDPDDRRGDD